MKFLDFFLAKTETKLTLNLAISQNPTIQISNGKYSEKELMLIALLFYARMLRVIRHTKEKKNLTTNFIVWYQVIEDAGKLDERALEEAINTYLTITKPTDVFTKSADVVLMKIVNGNYYLDVGVIDVEPLSPFVYLIFQFAWNLLKHENKIKLCDAFSLLSTQYELSKLSLRSAVSVPNSIINDLIL
jgi:hypothetical protein